jgi:hypothetical protein
MMSKKRLTKTARLLGAYSDLLNSGKDVRPEDYARQHPDTDQEYRDLLDVTYWLHGIKLEPRPIPPEARKRILHRVLTPMLRRAAEKLQKRVARLKDESEIPLTERPDLLLVLLYLKGRSDQYAEAIRGMTRLMKLLFLVQRMTGAVKRLDSGYEFIPGRFGPHSLEVYDDLQILIMAGLVRRTEFDEEGMPVIRREDYGELPETSFAGVNALCELTPEGQDFARRLVAHLEAHESVLLAGLATLKQQLARMRWQQIVAYVYQKYPEYTTESELLRKMQQPDD